MRKIALATSRKYATLLADDRLLVPEFKKLGVVASPAVWDAADVRWRDFGAVLIRSCWDYHLRLPDFIEWVSRIESLGLAIFNPASLIRWNSDKNYLRSLSQQQVKIPPTVWLNRDESYRLQPLLEELQWRRAVVKPTVSATAYGTWLTSQSSAALEQSKLDNLLETTQGSVMIQKFIPEITSQGEWSLIFFDKNFSHAVLKKPGADDFRVQEDFGGTATVVNDPPDGLVQQAAEILKKIPDPCLYARVDGLQLGRQFLLMELELIEPYLYLSTHVDAPARLAQTIASHLV